LGFRLASVSGTPLSSTLGKINMHYTEHYDNDFDSIAFYRNYPEYRPFIGKHFDDGKSKILLLAESHYLPTGSTAHLLPKNWYENSSVLLTDEERRWINTRGIINSGNNQHWKHKGHTIYRHLEKALIESGIPKSTNSFSYVACMNAFQRPAKTKDSLRVHEIDTENAFLVLSSVIEILKPDHICFVSSKAWKHLGGKLNVATDVIPHLKWTPKSGQ